LNNHRNNMLVEEKKNENGRPFPRVWGILFGLEFMLLLLLLLLLVVIMFIQFSSGGELLYNNNNNNNTGIIFPPSSSNFSFPFITSTVSNSAFRIQQRSNTDSTVATAVIMPTATEKQRQRRLLQQQQQQQQQQQRRRLVAKDDRCCRVLYTITSLAEYNTGSRATTKGSDRLLETLIPVVSEGVRSMQQVGYHVDVFLVSHYKLLPERKQLIQDSLPNNVSFRYWDNGKT